MNKILALQVAAGSPAAWDLKSFLKNATLYAKDTGGLLLMLLGVAALVWAGVQVVRKLMGNPQTSQQISWVNIVLLVLIGGALAVGGFSMVETIGSGGQTTIEELGGGIITPLTLR